MRRDPWCDSCPEFSDLISRHSRLKLSARLRNLGLNRRRRDPWRDSRPDFPDFMSRLSRLKLSARLCNLGLNPDAARPLVRLMSRFSDLMSRHSRLKLSARLCNLGLNPDAARPLVRLMSRIFRPYVQTFQTQTLGATVQFGSKSGCGATLGATHVQNFQTLCPDIPDSNSRRDYAIWV